ncbi:3-methyl-2-oxobutanoate hydroxymethyltransferase [Mesorhizobium sp. M0898]|uniref:3-methyl-2-oxobutanoate hydroxymethyltransferase n=1 Tax=Mesorhizobium sp. M0898 TaxID=2957020 RepID=UPI003337009B
MSLGDRIEFELRPREPPEALARRITEEIAIPMIGIGASPACDGQTSMTCLACRRVPGEMCQALPVLADTASAAIAA